jgi:hypothetical protein
MEGGWSLGKKMRGLLSWFFFVSFVVENLATQDPYRPQFHFLPVNSMELLIETGKKLDE